MLDRSEPPPGDLAHTTSGEPVPGAEPARGAPQRPSLVSRNTPPVLVKLTPPFSVRLSQFLWILSFLLGAFSVVYLFVIRETLLPLISEGVRRVSEGRSDQTYDAAADIVYWVVFGGMVALLLIQITLLVSFVSRRPHVRWWQLGTVVGQALLVALSMELIAVGERGEMLRPLFAGQCGLALLALLVSVLPGAVSWSARRHDVRRRQVVTGGTDF